MSNEDYKSLAWAHPLIRDWFIKEMGKPTLPQQKGWPLISKRKHTLICSPTGSGKTLAAFLTCINELVKKSLASKLKEETKVLYISPLKALGNDIQKNLKQPLNEIERLVKEKNLHMTPIEVAVRSGDTPQIERRTMLNHPPHILVTTPESLYLLLTAEKSRLILQTVDTIIIDEIHAMVSDKRGAHLALSLERLEAITVKKPVRIGLSATQKPIELMAQFLMGNRPLPEIVDMGYVKEIELKIEIPRSELCSVASHEMWDEMYDKISELALSHQSTIVFTNTRRLAERLAHHLKERVGEDQVLAHHGSLSKKLRLKAETKLKNGELKVLVATASLELGIDIGSVELVCQIGSPRSIAVMLQRIGRAGHWFGGVSKGYLFATTRDELVECAALAYALKHKQLDAKIAPKQPLDILAQQIVASCASQDWLERDLFNLIKSAYHYQKLTYEQYEKILDMLTQGLPLIEDVLEHIYFATE